MSPVVPVLWTEVVVSVGAADVDDVAALIASEVPAAAAGTEQRGDEVVFWVPAADVAAALAEARDAVTRWQAGGLAVDPARVRVAAAMPEAEWRDAWKKYFRVSRLTRQFVVVPSWESFTAGPEDIAIDLDPGMAFGTGTHASTRLVLEEIQALADRGVSPARILDVGCGSGILAIAAVKRWPSAACVAIDHDPIAVTATCDNAAINGVADRIAASTRPLDEPGQQAGRDEPGQQAGRDEPGQQAGPDEPGQQAGPDGPGQQAGPEKSGEPGDHAEPYDLVLANIQAHVLRELQSKLIASTAPGGTLILSGLLTPQAQPLADEFVAAGLRCWSVRASTDDPQWACAVLVR